MSTIIVLNHFINLLFTNFFFWRGGGWHFGFKMPVGHLRRETTTIRPIPAQCLFFISSVRASCRIDFNGFKTTEGGKRPQLLSRGSGASSKQLRVWVQFWKEKERCDFCYGSWELTDVPVHMHKPKGIEVCQNMGKTTTPSTAYSWPTAAS